MKKNKLSAYFVFILFFTLITFIILVIQNSYQSLIKPINQVKQTNVTPINPNLDLSIVAEIEKRNDVPEDATVDIVDTLSSETEVNVATNTSQIMPTPTITP